MTTTLQRRPQQPFPVATMLRAQQHHEAGWKPTRIRELLVEEGHPAPSINTIYQWVNPGYKERHRRSMRDRKARIAASDATFRLSSNTEEYQQAFTQRLQRDGVSCSAIATVSQIVFGGAVTAADVRERLTATSATVLRRHATVAEYEAFMVRLVAEGVPCATIAKVCRVVFGLTVSSAEVRELLRDVRPVHGNLGRKRSTP